MTRTHPIVTHTSEISGEMRIDLCIDVAAPLRHVRAKYFSVVPLCKGAEPQPRAGWRRGRRGTQTNNLNYYECIDRAGLAVLLQIY